MVHAGVSKRVVNNFWRDQPFDLAIESDEGNCALCFLKGRDKEAKNRIRETAAEVDWRGLDHQFADYDDGALLRAWHESGHAAEQARRDHAAMPAAHKASRERIKLHISETHEKRTLIKSEAAQRRLQLPGVNRAAES